MSRLVTAFQVLTLALLAACSNKDPDKAPHPCAASQRRTDRA